MPGIVLPVIVPGPEVISLNVRAHWAAVHRHTVALRARGHAAVPVRHLRFRSASLSVSVIYPTAARRRDVHNLMGTVKPLLDGMVDSGLLPDDDDEHLVGPFLRLWRTGYDDDVDAVAFDLIARLGHPSKNLGLIFRFDGPVLPR